MNDSPKQTPATIRRRFKTIMVARTAEAVPATTVHAPEAALPFLAALYADLDANKEHFLALSLNARNRVTGWHLVSTGTINSSLVHPRELFSAMLRLDAVSVILVHNHPSGEVTPSDDDIGLTRRLVQVGELLGIRVLDHLIIGPASDPDAMNWTAFTKIGLL